MVTKKELDDFIFLKFKLSKGQLITGVDLWNHLVENNVYEMMSGFLSISIPLELNEAIVVLDPLTNGFFGAKIDLLTTRNRNKFFKKYRITKIRVFDISTNMGESQNINFYGNYYNEDKKAWSNIEWILFAVQLDEK